MDGRIVVQRNLVLWRNTCIRQTYSNRSSLHARESLFTFFFILYNRLLSFITLGEQNKRLFLHVFIFRAVSCRIFIGTHDLYEVTANYTFSSSVFYEHPYYDPNEIANDVALVELPEKIVFGGKYCFEMIRNDNKNCL